MDFVHGEYDMSCLGERLVPQSGIELEMAPRGITMELTERALILGGIWVWYF